MQRPLPWLKYVDARHLDDDRVAFAGLHVESTTSDPLGTVRGFIVDVENGRPYYVVVDAGGWFTSKDYLLPIGQAHLDTQRSVLVADLTRERIARFPGFDLARLETLSADEIRRLNDATSRAVTGDAQAYSDTEHFSAAWSRPEFHYPDWWLAADRAARVGDVSPETSGRATDAVTRAPEGRRR